MNKAEVKAAMAEVGCPLAANPPTGGGTPVKAQDSNVISLRDVARGYDSSMDWRNWVNFMIDLYKLRYNVKESRCDLIGKIQRAIGMHNTYLAKIYCKDEELRRKIENILLEMVHTGRITPRFDEQVLGELAHSMSIPIYSVYNCVYDQMLTQREWLEMKLAYLRGHNADTNVHRRTLVMQSEEMMNLFAETARDMLAKRKRPTPVCPHIAEPAAAAMVQ